MLTDMQLTFMILIITTVCFIIPRFRSDMVALTSLLALSLTGLITVQEAFAGFANSVVIMIAALFVVGEGVFQTGLAERAGNLLIKYTGSSELKMTVFMLLLVALLSGFMSNTGTIAILLPVVVSLCRQMKIHPGKLLMPMAFASSMGGTLTLIGTAPNLIASQSLVDYGHESLTFLSFTLIGSAALVIGIVYLWFIGRRMLDKPLARDVAAREKRPDLLNTYSIRRFIHGVQVPKGNDSAGKTLKELAWASSHDVTVLEVQKKNRQSRLSPKRGVPPKFSVGADYAIEEEDTLVVYSRRQELDRFLSETKLRRLGPAEADLELEESQLAEVILTPQSRFINHTILEANFRDRFSLTVLAIKHQYKGPMPPARHERLLYGDTLLVHGKWKDIHLLNEEKEDVVALTYHKEPQAPPTHPLRTLTAGIILLWMIGMMVFEVLPAVITVIITALLMLVTRCVRQADHAYRSINWHTIVLIACMLPMATALENTGGVGFISETLITGLGTIGPMAVLAGLYVIASIFSQFISNTATAVLLYPVAILTAQQMGVNPVPMVMAVAFSASMAFATPVATPPNAMVMAAGKYSFLDFVRVGVPIQILIGLTIILLLPLVFPF